MASPSVAEIEQFRQGLIERMNFILDSKETQSPKEKLEVVLKEKWTPTQKEKEEKFLKDASKIEQIVRLEIAIVESIKGFIPSEVTSLVASALVRVRETGTLQSMNGVFRKYRNNVKIRQVIKLINAVYKYNENEIAGYASGGDLKSRIKHATLCPHCGEDAKYILLNMMESKSVLLPS